MPKAQCDSCGKVFEADTWEELATQLTNHGVKCQLLEPEPLEPEEEEWEERTPEFITFDEVGQEITGALELIDEIPFHDKKIARARLKTADGVQSFLLTTQLEPLLAGIELGTHIRVKYEGEEQTSAKRKVKKFRVWSKKRSAGNGGK